MTPRDLAAAILLENDAASPKKEVALWSTFKKKNFERRNSPASLPPQADETESPEAGFEWSKAVRALGRVY